MPYWVELDEADEPVAGAVGDAGLGLGQTAWMLAYCWLELELSLALKGDSW